jgi:hypothetical protein
MRNLKMKLTKEEIGLLSSLSVRDRQICNGRPDEGLQRLMESGYVEAHVLNLSDTLYVITDAGRAAHKTADA